MIRILGRSTLDFVRLLGGVILLGAETAYSAFFTKPRWKLFLRQVLEVGSASQVVVIVTGAFTGAVFAAQTFFQFHSLGMDSAVGPVVSISMCRELGPVLSALMVAGRVGAAMSSEIGTMRVTEQIDALRAMGVHPVDYLVVPRVFAMLLSMPLLVGESIAFGIGAGYLVGVDMLGIQKAYFISNLLKFTAISDLVMGLVKGLVFGLLIVMISCYRGLNAEEGAVGVGRAATSAVVTSSLAILISNFFLTLILARIFPS
jgi:phospholipid/cholesterol/gamma-HCH transport system permease protein